MRIEAPDTGAADELAECWVALARGQRAHGAHLRAAANRGRIREAIVRDIVSGGVLVARDDADELVGFVMFGPESERYAQDVSRGVIRNLVVVPTHRNEGIGSDLIAAAEAELERQGFDSVSLSVLADNAAARRFYDRAGYAPHRLELEKSLVGESDSHKADRE